MLVQPPRQLYFAKVELCMKAIRRLFLFPLLTFAFGLNSASAAATFSISPAISTNVVGQTVRLLTLEDGVPANPALTYQWSFNGVQLTNAARTIGSDLRELIITNTTLSDNGIYTVTVHSNTVVLAMVSATVLSEPAIESVVSESVGVDVTFRATATGGLLAYQWLWQGQELPGATGSTLHFANAYTAANAGYYSVRVTNTLGEAFSLPGVLFTKPAPAGTYQGIYFIDGGTVPQGSGYFQFTISGSRRSYSGRIVSGATVLRSSGTFSLAHQADILLPGPNDEAVPARLQLLTTNDNPQILSTNETTRVFLLGNRLHFSSKLTNSLAGRYTLALQNTNSSPLAPNGDGYATLKISPGGTVTLKGQAADGSRFSHSCGLSRVGDWPLYASLNEGRGRLVGMLRVARQTTSSIRGTDILWVKSPGPDALYPEGFDLALEGVGSTFFPAPKLPVLAWTNGVVSLHGGDLFVEGTPVWDFVQVVLRPPGTFRAEKGPENLKLSASPSVGTVEGRFNNVVTGISTPIRGVVLQQQRTARGFFISPEAAGAFSLERR
jgi:hypothetical protein